MDKKQAESKSMVMVVDKEQVNYYVDLGENPSSPKERRIYTIGNVMVAALCLFAAIAAIIKGGDFFFSVSNPCVFTLVFLKFAWEQNKARFYPQGKYFIQINTHEISFQSTAQKKPVAIPFDQIKEASRSWNHIYFKVSGKPLYHLDCFEKKRALLVFHQLQLALEENRLHLNLKDKSVLL